MSYYTGPGARPKLVLAEIQFAAAAIFNALRRLSALARLATDFCHSVTQRLELT